MRPATHDARFAAENCYAAEIQKEHSKHNERITSITAPLSPGGTCQQEVSNEEQKRDCKIDLNVHSVLLYTAENAANADNTPKRYGKCLKLMLTSLKPLDQRRHKLRFWGSKATENSSASTSNLRDLVSRRQPRGPLLRNWFRKASPETIILHRASKALCNLGLAAAEVAMLASVRHRARKAARAGAFAAAAYAYVTAEELSPHASHGSLAAAISKACEDVSGTSLVVKSKNEDYIRLHNLFYHHFKYRGPDYYKPLSPFCTVQDGPEGRLIVHCKMEESSEDSRGFEALGKNSPLILFMKHFPAQPGLEVSAGIRLLEEHDNGLSVTLAPDNGGQIGSLHNVSNKEFVTESVWQGNMLESDWSRPKEMAVNHETVCSCNECAKSECLKSQRENSHGQQQVEKMCVILDENSSAADDAWNLKKIEDHSDIQASSVSQEIGLRSHKICQCSCSDASRISREIHSSTHSALSISPITSNLKWDKADDTIEPEFAVIPDDSSKWNESGHPKLQLADFFCSPELSEQIGIQVRSQAIPLSPTYEATSEMQGKIIRVTGSLLSPIAQFLETYTIEIGSEKNHETDFADKFNRKQNNEATSLKHGDSLLPSLNFREHSRENSRPLAKRPNDVIYSKCCNQMANSSLKEDFSDKLSSNIHNDKVSNSEPHSHLVPFSPRSKPPEFFRRKSSSIKKAANSSASMTDVPNPTDFATLVDFALDLESAFKLDTKRSTVPVGYAY
ncbi:uncharacterized protein ZBAI_02817 [Zygosaccharomyces bailii ISA1307]|uniref:ZYBA0S12-02806g1_1 n=1 Tax=Zygosaccharomyces bailii (strain CLIB 213 / ATCC 58445 / CBS 680 / BCRC 21525 / NBRC 1098 / NCYC 1416 / NRRL Y-2227) TaxID=1333698 RepID=A0A8J2XAX6_ZYGB2|nr:ZYBA0S12-02806g1_1 [Zygosaccharomyces bailii CLIB 213]CDH11031.1 uncharacterized protein ZBAI_02817 [Zygosaccharomyces bailii ISA1307]